MLAELHQLFNERPRYSFPLSAETNLPRNGIFTLFEAGELYGPYDRIVFVGSHKGSDNLRSRLEEHFVIENKNRSILRKHLGRALLNEEESDRAYLPLWDLDVTSREDKEKNSPLLSPEFEQFIERKISAYMCDNFSFAIVPIESVEERKKWTTKIASTLAQADDISPSEDWLGQHSPNERIRLSGLWQVQKLDYEPLTRAELERLVEISASGIRKD